MTKINTSQRCARMIYYTSIYNPVFTRIYTYLLCILYYAVSTRIYYAVSTGSSADLVK